MSISVDDLVASLNGNHIGQEAIDLATLQAQLTKTLYCHTSSSYTVPAGQSSCVQPVNTPTCRTPSSSFSWERSDVSRARSSSVVSLKRRGSVMDERSSDRDSHPDDMDEDERMVEDLLCPSSPAAANAASSHFFPAHPHQSASTFNTSEGLKGLPSSYAPHGVPLELPSPPNTSVFATTDPFYLAQLQASQQRAGVSYFANAGRPSPQSPFVLTEQGPSSNSHPFAHRIPVSPDATPHQLFAW